MEVHRHSNIVATTQIASSQENSKIEQKKKQHEENKVAKKPESYFAAAENFAGKHLGSFFMTNPQVHQANKPKSNPGMLNALYLNAKHLAALCKFFKNPKMNPKVIEGFAKKLYGSSSKDKAKLINDFIEEQGYSTAETYVVLSFLFDQGSSGGNGQGGDQNDAHDSMLSQAEVEETQELLQSLVTKIEQQNSAYLFEVFELTRHQDVQSNPKLAMGIAGLQNNDSIDHSSLSGVLKFIQDTLDGDFTRLVSKIMRLRAEMLVMLTSPTLTPEQKSQLASFGQIEQNLIILNTIQKSVDRFGKEVEGSKLYDNEIIKDNVRIIQELLVFADLQVVTELSIKNLLKNIGITGTPSELLGFKNKLIQLLHKLPVVMFKNSDEHKAKIIQGVRKTFYTTNVSTDNEVEFSFLRKDRTPIRYI